jgi:DNA-binding MarR family transcriptional regulator
MTEIASFTMHRHHSVSNLIKKISAQGLVEKVKRPGSKEFAIVLTEKGRQLCNRTPKASVDMIFDILSQEDRRELAQLLKRILSKARSLMGVDYKPPFLR